MGDMAAAEALAVGPTDHWGLLRRKEFSDPTCPDCIFSVLLYLCRVQLTFSGRKFSPTQGITYALVCFKKQLTENLHIPTN